MKKETKVVIIILIVVAALVVLTMAGWFIFGKDMYERKKAEDTERLKGNVDKVVSEANDTNARNIITLEYAAAIVRDKEMKGDAAYSTAGNVMTLSDYIAVLEEKGVNYDDLGFTISVDPVTGVPEIVNKHID